MNAIRDMKLNDCKQGLKVICRGKVGVIRTLGNRLVTVVMEDGSRGHYHPGNLILETDIAVQVSNPATSTNLP